MAQQIFSVTENIYCLKLLFLRPNQHLFEFSSNINNRIKYATCLKLTIEVTDVVLVHLLLTLNIFDMLLWCVFADFEDLNSRWNTLLP